MMYGWFRRWRAQRTGQRCCDCGTPLSPGAGVSVVHGWRMEGDPRRRCWTCEMTWQVTVDQRLACREAARQRIQGEEA